MANVYEVGIKIGMMNAVSPVLALLSSEVLGLDRKVTNLIGKFRDLNTSAKLALSGGIMLGAGVGLGRVIDELAQKGNNLTRVLNRMRQAGVDAQTSAKAIAAARAASFANPNTDLVSNAKLANDLRMVFGSQTEANQYMPLAVRSASMLKWLAAGGRYSGNSENLLKEVFSALKSAEISGNIHPADAQKYIEQLIATKVAFGDQVSIADILNAQRTAGPAFFNLNSAGRATFAAMTQELKSTTGAGLRQAFQKVVSGATLSNYAIETFSDLGLINPGAAHWNAKIGKFDKVSEQGILGRNLFATDPRAWVERYLHPALDAHVTKMGITDPTKRRIEETGLIQRMFQGRNAAQYISALFFQDAKFQKDYGVYLDALHHMNPNAIKGTLDYQNQAVAAQFENVMTDLGTSFTPLVTKLKADLVPVLQSIDKVAQDKPAMAEIAKVATVLSGTLIVGGITALGAALAALLGPIGLAVIGISALIGFLVAFRKEISDILGLNTTQAQHAAAQAAISSHRATVTGPSVPASANLQSIFTSRGATVGSHAAATANDPVAARRRFLGSLGSPNPPASAGNTHVSVLLDGKEIAAKVIKRVTSGGTFTTGAPAFDGMSTFGGR